MKYLCTEIYARGVESIDTNDACMAVNKANSVHRDAIYFKNCHGIRETLRQ